MNQFKDVFGAGTRPYSRAVNSQRLSGSAGNITTWRKWGGILIHHTFFEMLGNWSFPVIIINGRAIAWGWGC